MEACHQYVTKMTTDQCVLRTCNFISLRVDHSQEFKLEFVLSKEVTWFNKNIYYQSLIGKVGNINSGLL